MAEPAAPRHGLFAPLIRDARGGRVRVLEFGELRGRLQADRDVSGVARRRIARRMWSKAAIQHWLPTYMVAFALLLIAAVGLPILITGLLGRVSGYVMGIAITVAPITAAPILLIVFSRRLAAMRAWAIVGEGYCAQCGYPLADLEGAVDSGTAGREREIIMCPECGAAWEVAPEPTVTVGAAATMGER